MDRDTLPRELRPFLDDAGKLKSWPGRQKVQRMAIAHLAGKFEPGRDYTERDVNFLLMEWHTFGDWAILRRALCDWRHLERDGSGRAYRLAPVPPADDAEAARES